jgi:hypothetical protein
MMGYDMPPSRPSAMYRMISYPFHLYRNLPKMTFSAKAPGPVSSRLYGGR